MIRTARKQILTGLLALSMMFTLLPGLVLASPETVVEVTSEYCCYDCVRGGYSIEEIREILNAGGQIYQDVRVHYEDVGVVTYTVPVSESELEHLLNMHYGNIQPRNYRPFTVTQIRDSERSHADSIVVILLSDGFAYEQIGTWPNPAHKTALWHADQVITRMLNTRPFNLFADLFTVYMVHSYGAPLDPRFGTEGFDVDQVITQELLDRYARGGVIHLHSVWSLWGDVDDNGRVDIDDIDSMRRNILGLVPRLPMNRAPGDV
ncbi:MAG: hypothetical protein FWD05_14305, partial [Oscillospiraceae bacterium]|nr:hypothetical protein [Oscillospiraceae bacterium]